MNATEDLDEAFEKQTLGGNKNDLSPIPDGEHTLEIVSAALKTPNGKPLIEYKYEIVDGGPLDGTQATHAHWLKRQDNQSGQVVVNEIELKIVKDNLKALGFDSDAWTKANGRPFSTEFTKAAPILVGLRFKAKKTSKAGSQGKTFHSLYVKERATFNGEALDGKPLQFTAVELNKAGDMNLDD